MLKACEQNYTKKRIKCKKVQKMLCKTEQQIEISDPKAESFIGKCTLSPVSGP